MSESSLALDAPGRPKAVGSLIRSIMRGEGRIALAVAYVTRDPAELLRIPVARLESALLICDPYSGACNPALLEKLAKRMRVVARQRFHAKVYAGPGGAIVSSANLSTDALDAGTEEAALRVTTAADIRRVWEWLDDLARTGTPISDLLDDTATWALIKGRWEGRKPVGGRRRHNRAKKASLLAALTAPLADGTLDIRELRIEFVDRDVEIDEATAKDAAKHAAVSLSKNWQDMYTVTGAPPSGRTLARYAADLRESMRNRELLTLYVESEDDGRILRFRELDGEAARVDAVTHYRGGVHAFFSVVPASLDLRKDASLLIRRLNTGLVARPKAAARLTTYEVAKPAELAALL